MIQATLKPFIIVPLLSQVSSDLNNDSTVSRELFSNIFSAYLQVLAKETQKFFVGKLQQNGFKF